MEVSYPYIDIEDKKSLIALRNKILELLDSEIEHIKYEERSMCVTVAVTVRSSYVRQLLPLWEEIGSSEKLIGMLDIENKLKEFQNNSYKRIQALEDESNIS